MSTRELMQQASELPKLTPTQRLHEVTMAFAQRAASPPEHSVEISRNAKGVAQFSVTVRGFDLGDVLGEAVTAYGVLEAKHPYPVSTNGGAE